MEELRVVSENSQKIKIIYQTWSVIETTEHYWLRGNGWIPSMFRALTKERLKGFPRFRRSGAFAKNHIHLDERLL